MRRPEQPELYNSVHPTSGAEVHSANLSPDEGQWGSTPTAGAHVDLLHALSCVLLFSWELCFLECVLNIIHITCLGFRTACGPGWVPELSS